MTEYPLRGVDLSAPRNGLVAPFRAEYDSRADQRKYVLMSAANETKLSFADFERLSQAVYRHCKINLHDGKRQLVEARLAKLSRQLGFNSTAELIDHVLENPQSDQFTRMIDVLSTNLTSFFREPDHFAYLQKYFLPDLVATRKASPRPRLRAWSAGCSSGEEPYTLAMVLRETIPDVERWDAKILATDISTRVLATAARGVYDESRVSGVAADLRSQYFAVNRMDGRTFFDVRPNIKDMIAFRHLNLMDDWPFRGPFDVIFCRNVMIYFDKPTQENLVNRFHDVLSPGGLLFTGHSESLTGVKHRFEYVRPTIYRRHR
jgi:chemotaxis protein methyltransferase CheR